METPQIPQKVLLGLVVFLLLLVGGGAGYLIATPSASPTGGVVMGFGQMIVQTCEERIIPTVIGGEYGINYTKLNELGLDEQPLPDCFVSGVCYIDEGMESQIMYQSIKSCQVRG